MTLAPHIEGPGDHHPALRGWRFPRGRVRPQAQHDLRIHALPQGRLVRGHRETMSYRAIYTYAWDLAETGVRAAVGRVPRPRPRHRHHCRELSRRQVPAAARQGRQGLFPARTARSISSPIRRRYGAIKPVANTMLAERDVLRELTRQKDIATNVWLVLLHNTLLGMAHPEATVANAFGDRYVYSLCPSAPEARAYAVGLASDVTESYRSHGVSIEIAGLRALCAWLPPRIRAEPAEPLARQPARALLLRALPARARKRRHRRRRR